MKNIDKMCLILKPIAFTATNRYEKKLETFVTNILMMLLIVRIKM